MLRESAKQEEERRLCERLWTVLRDSSDSDKATLSRLKCAVLTILNFPAAASTASIGRFPKKFAREFELFYLNRMMHVDTSPSASIKKSRTEEETHTPRLNGKSIKLAERSNEKRKELVRQRVGVEKTSLNDLLVLVKRVQEDQIAMERKRREQQAIKDCTFRPDIGRNKSKERHSREERQTWLCSLAKSAKKAV